jgi:hypothetical protein
MYRYDSLLIVYYLQTSYKVELYRRTIVRAKVERIGEEEFTSWHSPGEIRGKNENLVNSRSRPPASKTSNHRFPSTVIWTELSFTSLFWQLQIVLTSLKRVVKQFIHECKRSPSAVCFTYQKSSHLTMMQRTSEYRQLKQKSSATALNTLLASAQIQMT